MKVAVYGRYGENRGRGADIMERQINQQKLFAESHNHEVVKIYTDLGNNGYSMGENLKRLRKEAARHAFEAVLVQDVPMLSRNAQNLMKLITEFKKLNINLVFTEYPYSRISQ
jgi:site-specific DNA recombinase